MRSAQLWCLVLLATLGACTSDITCPADLAANGASCSCPEWTEKRAIPVVLPNGSPDYCLEKDPWSEGGAPSGNDGTASEGGERKPGVEGTDTSSASGSGSPPSTASTDDAGGVRNGPEVSPAPPISPSPPCAPTDERCDQVDNDCDGTIDEGISCAPPISPGGCTTKVWYRDCDGDGYAASRVGSAAGCDQPSPPSQCRGWTDREPVSGQTDCDDDSIAYAPGIGFGFNGFGDGDLNCDGVVEPRARVVAAPVVVERRPRDDAPFCRFDKDLQLLDCECFWWDPWLWKGEEQPPCAGAPSAAIEAHYFTWTGADAERRCRVAVTPAAAAVDTYQVLQTCR